MNVCIKPKLRLSIRVASNSRVSRSVAERGETAVSRLTGVGFADHLRNAVVPLAPYALYMKVALKNEIHTKTATTVA